MTKGYYLVVEDETTCGGIILEGDFTHTLFGRAVAREEDRVSCGKHPGTYIIVGHIPHDTINGRKFAGTLHSRSSCPCNAEFIPSMVNDTYEFIGEETAAKSSSTEPEQRGQGAKKPKREITLTLGVFFDGTGNNANNTDARLKACNAEHYEMNNQDATSTYARCIQIKRGYSGTSAGSHLGYYTNVHWLNTLYNQKITVDTGYGQHAIYIEGIGTETGEGDSTYGMGTGTGDTGVVKKTDKAVRMLIDGFNDYFYNTPDARFCIIKELQFDIFGFSRGAAAARHFANRVFSQDPQIIAAIKEGLGNVEFSGTPGGKTRFIGIFDTVAAIGTPENGFNPHTADTGDVNIALRPGVAEKVFHITAQHECRFNFALNSVKPAWPEVELPGAHSDIGGGYNPVEHEAYFLSRPQFETVPFSTDDTQTRVYQQTVQQLKEMNQFPAINSICQNVEIEVKTWHDDRMPADHYGRLQKRSAAALTLDRPTYNDWSKVSLRVMLDAAQEAGVKFDPIDESVPDFALPEELNYLSEKAVRLGRAVRSGDTKYVFVTQELKVLAKKYLHCSANWNSVIKDEQGLPIGAVKPAKLVTFTNRPDEHWRRTVYNMDGKKIWK
ncbi:putative Zn-binding protein involved in type VI secretion [Ewingella americana]